jgi:Flp pilus assembly protein TadG
MTARLLTTQRGGETVEFALFTVPLLVLLFAIFLEFGFAFADKAVITDASRAAAREAIRGGSYATAKEAANNVLQSAATWGSDLPYQCPDEPNACSDEYNVCCDIPTGAVEGELITVTLAFPFKFRILTPLSNMAILPFLPDLTGIQLSAQTVMGTQPH